MFCALLSAMPIRFFIVVIDVNNNPVHHIGGLHRHGGGEHHPGHDGQSGPKSSLHVVILPFKKNHMWRQYMRHRE